MAEVVLAYDEELEDGLRLTVLVMRLILDGCGWSRVQNSVEFRRLPYESFVAAYPLRHVSVSFCQQPRQPLFVHSVGP